MASSFFLPTNLSLQMFSRHHNHCPQRVSLVASLVIVPLPVIAGLLVVVALLGPAATASAETWTNLQGTNSIEAEMIGLWEDTLILQRNDGRRLTVKLDSLRGDSRIQARNLAAKISVERDERVEELKQRMNSAKAPAPDKFPVPPPAPEYTPLPKDLSAGDFIQQVNEALSGGHLRVLYDCRPPSYRKDISDLIRLIANKTSPATWQAIAGMPHRLGGMIINRQNWIFSSPQFKKFSPDDREKARWALLGLANVLYHGLSPDAMELETFRTTEFETWLDSWDATVAPYVAEMIDKSGVDLSSQTKIVSEDEGTAVISTGQGDSPVEITLVLVEGFWVPKTIADSWVKDIEQAKKKVAATADGKYLEKKALGAAMAGAAFELLVEAESAEEYFEEFDSIVSQASSDSTFRRAIETMLSPIQTLIRSSGSRAKPEADSASSPAGKSPAPSINLSNLGGNDNK